MSLRIAIQKSGRLTDKSLDLLKACGLDIEDPRGQLSVKVHNFPMEILFLRDDDIPEYVHDGVCQLGIVGLNTVKEKAVYDRCAVIKELGYGTCRLSMAVSQNLHFVGPGDLQNQRIATSYPHLVRQYLSTQNIDASIVELSGSVEIAPTLGNADVVCDLVSTGKTLAANGLKEVITLLESQSVLIGQTNISDPNQVSLIEKLGRRMESVLMARNCKYIMMNAPKEQLSKIQDILPGLEKPSIMNIHQDPDTIAIHAVSREDVFWETIEKLKDVGASSILVTPIEKIIP